MNTVICMKWGGWPSADANRLYKNVMNHVTSPTRFVVFTDETDGLDPGIEVKPLPPMPFVQDEKMRRGPWRKLTLWSDQLDIDGDVLFLDLDTVVTGSLDVFFNYLPGEFCIIRNWTEKFSKIGNSSVMRFRAKSASYILDEFCKDPARNSHKFQNEQIFVSRTHRGPINFWPKRWCPSFKKTLMPIWPIRLWKNIELPKDAHIVVFTGHPRPEDALVGKWPSHGLRNQIVKRFRPVTWLNDIWK